MDQIARFHFDLFAGEGEARALLRSLDWNASPLGPPASWPHALRAVVSLMLDSKFPMFVAWGPELIFLYNDAYSDVLGAKHPSAQGRRFYDIWYEIWHDISPLIDRALRGEATYAENMPLLMLRKGHEEQTYFTFSYSPTRDDSGHIAGMFCACTETTRQVEADRRQAFQLRMADRLRNLLDPGEITAVAAELLGRQLGVTRVGYGGVDAATQTVRVARDWTDGSVPSLGNQSTSLDGFGRGVIEALRAGETLRVPDVAADPRSGPFAAAYASIGTRAMIVVPLIKEDRLTSILSVGAATPRHWTDEEVMLAQDVGERTWAALERIRAEEERRRAETALARRLAEETDRLRTLFEQAPGFMAVLRGPEHIFELANPAYMRVFGPRPLIGMSVREALPEVAGQGFFELLDEVYATGKPFAAFDAAVSIAPVSGQTPTVRYVDFIYQPVTDAQGAVAGIFVEGYDVTERKQAAQRLRESEARYRTLVENISNVVWRTDAQGMLMPDNHSWGGFTGQSEAEYLGAGWLDAVHPDDRVSTIETWQRAIRQRSPYEAAYRLRRRDGLYRDVVSRGVAVLTPEGNVLEWIGNCADVSEAKHAEEALRAADRRKDEFLAMLAHELRNPLAPISMAAQILKMSRIDERQVRQTSEIIARQAEHMTRLINDLLDVSRVTRGLVTLAREPLDLKTIVSDAVEQVRNLIEGRRHRLTLRLTAEPAHVSGDRTRLIQVATNLLNNAAKYTPEGGEITLRVEVTGDTVVLAVRDNGIGITSELLPHVFELFTQAERSPDRSQGGLGLGLGLVKSLVELQGGGVDVRSAGAGQGSEFIVRLPRLQRAPTGPLQSAADDTHPAAPDRLRVMVVDDNADAAQTLAMFLTATGHQVTVEHNARSALQRAHREPPDALVLDIGLPDMDGYELARKLRAHPETRRVLLIALTGYGQSQDLERSRSAGFDHHLVKPADTVRLAALLAESRPGNRAAG